MASYYIANLAGGDKGEFEWTGELSDEAIDHADAIAHMGGPVFSGPAAHEAREAFEMFCEARAAWGERCDAS